jgi:hypothetical protein
LTILKEKNKMATKALWLKIANVRMNGERVQFQVEGDASDDRNGTWLSSSQDSPKPEKIHDMVLKALQDNRKTTGKLVADSKALKISRLRVQFQ